VALPEDPPPKGEVTPPEDPDDPVPPAALLEVVGDGHTTRPSPAPSTMATTSSRVAAVMTRPERFLEAAFTGAVPAPGGAGQVSEGSLP
jgi:hypothetical protein